MGPSGSFFEVVSVQTLPIAVSVRSITIDAGKVFTEEEKVCLVHAFVSVQICPAGGRFISGVISFTGQPPVKI